MEEERGRGGWGRREDGEGEGSERKGRVGKVRGRESVREERGKGEGGGGERMGRVGEVRGWGEGGGGERMGTPC